MKYMKYMAALLVCAGMAYADAVVVQPDTVTYGGTNPDSGITGLDDAAALGDGSGLSLPLTVENIDTVTHDNPLFSSPGNAWATDDPGGAGGDFFADTANTVVFDIVLDGTYELATFYNWSYDFDEAKPNANNIKTFTLDYGVGDFATAGGSFDLTAPANNGSSTVDLGGITADRLRITVTDNWYDNGVTYQGGDRVSAAEFAFVTVPEPATFGMVAVFGGAVLFIRRKLAI